MAELEHQVTASNKKVSLLEAANVKIKNRINVSNDKIDHLEGEKEKQINALKDQVTILTLSNADLKPTTGRNIIGSATLKVLGVFVESGFPLFAAREIAKSNHVLREDNLRVKELGIS